jgi:hypothetical protein
MYFTRTQCVIFYLIITLLSFAISNLVYVSYFLTGIDNKADIGYYQWKINALYDRQERIENKLDRQIDRLDNIYLWIDTAWPHKKQ